MNSHESPVDELCRLAFEAAAPPRRNLTVGTRLAGCPKRKAITELVEHYAKLYGVHPRTVRRWRKAGIDPSDPGAVARYLVSNDSATLIAIEKTINLINETQGH